MQPYNGDPNQAPGPPQNQPPAQPYNNYPGSQPSGNYPGPQPTNYNGNWQQPLPNRPYYGPPAVQPKKGLPVWVWIIGGLVALGVIGGILAAAGALTASVSFTTGGSQAVKEVTLAKGYQNGEAVNPTTTFSPQDNPLHSVVKLENTKAGTLLKSVWTAVDAGGEQNFEIGSKTLTLTDARNYTADYTVELPKPWPVGKYKFELYINDKLEKTVNFTVQ